MSGLIPGNPIQSLNPIKNLKRTIKDPIGTLKKGLLPQKTSLKDPVSALGKSLLP